MKKIYSFLMLPLLSAMTFCCKTPQGELEDKYNQIPAAATDTWLVHSLSDINTYASAKPSNRQSFTLAKNETEHIQLVIKTKTNEKLTIERSGMEEDILFSCRSLKSFEKMEDVLVPCNGEIEPKKNLVKVWLTFQTKTTSKTGKYKEIIKFKTATEEYAVAFSIEIVDIEIPETPSFPSVFGINPDNFILTGMSEEQKTEARKEVADLLLEYRIAPYFSTWLAGSMKTECFSSPYPWNDERTWEYLKNPGFNRIAFPYHGLSDAELESMLDRIQAEGLMEKAYFYIWDEPTLVSEYSQIHTMADRIHSYAPSAKVLTSFYCGPKDGEHKDDLFATFDLLSGATSIFCTGVWSLQGNEARSAMCRAKIKEGQEWWSYVCMADAPGLAQNSTGIPNRVVMWRNWKEQTTGFLYWVVNSFGSMSPLTSRQGLPEGDGVLVYPGKPFGSDKPCVSIRLERWRDGAEDYELLAMYEKKLGRSAAETLFANVYTNPGKFTDNIKHVDALKKNLIEGIVK